MTLNEKELQELLTKAESVEIVTDHKIAINTNDKTILIGSVSKIHLMIVDKR